MKHPTHKDAAGPALFRGVTLTELLVVMVIIAILSTIAVPVFINHAERARVSSAQQEVREIANAEDACGAIHGFYVPLQVLDDIPGQAGNNGVPSNADAIATESGIFVIDFGLPINLLQTNGSVSINNPGLNPRVISLVKGWAGPFLNPQRVYSNRPSPYDFNQEDFPLDPWGNPYRFYSPVGLIGSSSTIPPYAKSDFSGSISNHEFGRFDRWAIVSWGPDGQEDPQGGIQRDDIFYTFGIVRETAFSETIFVP